MSKLEIQVEIDRLKMELESVKGTETETYSRIVGYFRPVKSWNSGKAAEYEERKIFSKIT